MDNKTRVDKDDDLGESSNIVDVNMSWEERLAKELPKVELHLHLDGSLSPGKFAMYLWLHGRLNFVKLYIKREQNR